jgi:hypothetical protein
MKHLKIKHSGLMGDIIYSIPTMKILMSKLNCTGIDLWIPNDKIPNSTSEVKHIGGTLMFTDAMYNFIKPLLITQSIFHEIHFISESEIPKDCIDFDSIRYGSINTSSGHIPNYYSKAFGAIIDSTQAWLEIPKESTYEKKFRIIIGRSTRYVNSAINYNELSKSGGKIGFIGTGKEFEIFKKEYSNLEIEFIKVKDSLEAIHIINKSDIYIGNQSFFFSIAEAIKVPRLIESFELVPNVIPTGGKCGQFITTKGLCMQVNSILDTHIECIENKNASYHLNSPFIDNFN